MTAAKRAYSKTPTPAAKRRKPATPRKPRAAAKVIETAVGGIGSASQEYPLMFGAANAPQRVARSVRFPSDWWEALKDRWFPAWALARWPVRFTEHAWWEDTLADSPWTAAQPIKPGTPVTINGQAVGIAQGSSTTCVPGELPKVTVNFAPSRPDCTPRQHGWDDAAAGVCSPEQYSPEGSPDYIAYCYGWFCQKAGKPFTTGVRE